MKPSLSVSGAVIYVTLLVVVGFMIYQTAPAVEGHLFPVARVDYMMPYDPSVSGASVVRFKDRACWAWHLTKPREATTRWWSVVIVLPDSTRIFTGALDGRTGTPYRSTDARNGGYSGISRLCVTTPPDVPDSMGFQIESFARYLPSHRLWSIDFRPAPIQVPPLGEVDR
jgi:hypothetical protein